MDNLPNSLERSDDKNVATKSDDELMERITHLKLQSKLVKSAN